MICKNCNKEIDNDSKFCAFCGHKIENIESKKEDTENLKESISNNLETKLDNIDENKNQKKLTLKEVIYRIIAVIISYLGFVAVKIWLITKGISFGEITLLSIFIFLAIYKIIVGYSLNIKSSKSMGILFTTISIILVFISVRGEDKVNNSYIEEELNYLKKQTPKKLDENTTLLNLEINGMNVGFKYYMNNLSVDNMTNEAQKNFKYNVKQELCKTPIFIKVMNHNYKINLKYLDNNYNIIGEVQLSKDECK